MIVQIQTGKSKSKKINISDITKALEAYYGEAIDAIDIEKMTYTTSSSERQQLEIDATDLVNMTLKQAIAKKLGMRAGFEIIGEIKGK